LKFYRNYRFVSWVFPASKRPTTTSSHILSASDM